MQFYLLLSVFGFLVVFATLPLLTGYCAASYGRSFWLWFALGWALPILSFLLLFALIARRYLNQGERLLAEAKAILAAAETAKVDR
jgi:hypothetical protein